MIDALINKFDTFEIVRDKIAAILVAEVNSQKILAAAESLDPLLWDLRIFAERSNPWELWLNSTDDRRPIVNVWFDNASFDKSVGGVVERQAADGVFNIDCYGFGLSAETVGGHTPGDSDASFEVSRALRLVRNILMAATYTYLDLRGAVWQRWVQSVSIFQPQQDARAVQNVIGARLALGVRYNELSPQVTGEILEKIAVTVKRLDSGELVYFNAEYDH